MQQLRQWKQQTFACIVSSGANLCPTVHMQNTEGSARATKRQKSSSQATAFNAISDVIDLSNDDDISTHCSHDLFTPTFIKLHGSTAVGGSPSRQTHQACPAGIALLKTIVCLIWQFHLGNQHCCMSVHGLNKHQVEPLSNTTKLAFADQRWQESKRVHNQHRAQQLLAEAKQVD